MDVKNMARVDDLKKKFIPKLKTQKLAPEELPECLELMVLVANSSEEFKEDFGDFTKTYQFSVTDKPEAQWMWLKVVSGKFTKGMGKTEKPDLTFTMNAKLSADMISGAVDSNSAFMKGDLKITGQIKDGVKFQKIMALFNDVLDV
jgi:putative sterol carrier protein